MPANTLNACFVGNSSVFDEITTNQSYKRVGTRRLVARRLARELPNVSARHLREKGRGRALRAAWTASDAAVTMEQGVDGILMNTALAEAREPVRMARAMALATEAGRLAYLAGRMPRRERAVPSSPRRGMLD